MGRLRILTVFGTRPDTIKLAPVVQELRRYPDLIESITVGTAQHREMMDQVLPVFGIRPDYDLQVMIEDQTLFDIAERGLNRMHAVLRDERPDLVLVHGDTSTAFIAALAGFYSRTQVGHVEAGLRTGVKYEPYPEEMNRRLVGCLADVHFAPTIAHKENLIRENVQAESIYVTGNTVVDAVMQVAQTDLGFSDDTLKALDYESQRVILVTAHRRENIGEPLEEICSAIKAILERHPDTAVVLPVHPNPRVKAIVEPALKGVPRCHLIQPTSYPDMVRLIKHCYMVLTDSGGLQEEAPALDKPVLVLRRTTERPEGLAAGTLRLAGVSRESIVCQAEELLTDAKEYQKMVMSPNPYGDGQASRRTVMGILHHLGHTRIRPDDFA